jgi:hypothetical protein
VKRNPAAAGKIGQQAKASVATAAKKRIAVPSLKTNTDLGRRGVVSMSAKSKVIRSQNVKNLATEKGKEVLERIQGAGARRGGRETKYNAPGSAGAKRIAKTAATQSRASAFAQQQVYSKGGGAYRGQRPEFNWKRSRATAKPAAAKPAKAAKRKAIGAISEAKAGRIISRIDANRPGLRKATGSARKTQNSIRTQGKATDFALAAGARARKQGKSLSVNESLQRAVKNATAKSRKSPKATTPAAPKAAKPAKARRQVTETQLGNAAKRAKKVEISRYLSESDRMNAGGKETFAKRSAASQLRAEKGKRTSQAAKAFLSNYGTPSLFGQRPVSSTKDSPKFGSKKRKRR